MRRFASSPGAMAIGTALALALAGCGEREVCTFQEAGDGTTIMRCPDGSSVRLRDVGADQPPGGIRGTVRFFGRTNHEGIEVKLAGIAKRATTDAEGRFALADVPAGQHRIQVSAPGYESASQDGILVLPNDWATRDIELRTGRRLLEGAAWRLTPAPHGRTFLAYGDRELHLVDPVAVRSWHVASRVHPDFRFAREGSWVLYRVDDESGSGTGRLEIFETAPRRRRIVAENVLRWDLTADEQSFVYDRRVGDQTILETYHEPSRRRAAVGHTIVDWRASPDGAALVVRLLVQSNGGTIALVAWDLAAAGGTSLGMVPFDANLPAFAPDGRSFVFRNVMGDSLLWDGVGQTVEPLGRDVVGHAFGPKGDQLAWLRSDGTLVHLDLATRERFEIRTSVFPPFAFSPDGEALAYFHVAEGEDGEPVVELSIWNRRSRASTAAVREVSPIELVWDPSGRYVFVREGDGRLIRWGEGGAHVVAQLSQRTPLFHPDGTGFLFHEGERLHWSELDADEAVPLEEPVRGVPIRWSPDGRRLLFITYTEENEPAFGHAWVFDRETGGLERVASDVRLGSCTFLPDGSILALRRFDRGRSDRGELVRGGVPIATGVRDGYRMTPDGTRVAFLTDALPIDATGVLALWEVPSCDSEALPEGGLLPVDSSVRDQLVGEDWIAWVNGSEDRAGLYVSHYPRDLPPPPRSTAPDPRSLDREGVQE